jgi:hypothetical protein
MNIAIGELCVKPVCDTCPIKSRTPDELLEIGVQIMEAYFADYPQLLPVELRNGKETGQRGPDSCLHGPRIAAAVLGEMSVGEQSVTGVLHWLVDRDFGTQASINQPRSELAL